MDSIVFLTILCVSFSNGYVFLSQYHPDYPGECSLEKVVLHPPLPELSINSLKPGQTIGVEYDRNKDYCNKLSCSVWKNHKGEGYRLENFGCSIITQRPNNCTEYAKEDNRLPWPQCCYHKICPRVIRDEF